MSVYYCALVLGMDAPEVLELCVRCIIRLICGNL